MTLWLVRPPHGFKPYERINLDLVPCPTILASGDPGAFAYFLEEDGMMMPVTSQMMKPPYRVPSMAEITALPWNGFTVVSTFSGCGGSCLGYRMAGFKVLWANEFIPAAQDVYRHNHPETLLDCRDIRQISAQDILTVTGLQVGTLDLLDGSPPCASFSTAGKRERHWGKVRPYSDTRQRTDDLFFEYARLLKGLQPKVFVAENVSGLIKGIAKGYFQEILRTLKACGYRVEARLLDAQWLGVPQQRQRIIFIGVRQDLGHSPVFPKPLSYRYSVRDALPWIMRQGDNAGFGSGSLRDTTVPSPTIGTSVQAGNGRFPPSIVEVIHDESGQWSQGPITERPAPTVRSGRAGTMYIQQGQPRAYLDTRGAFGHDTDMTNIPAPTVLSDSVGTHWIVEPHCYWDASDKRARIVDPSTPAPTMLQHGRGWNQYAVQGKIEKRKFTIAELKRICAFPDDFVLTGSYAQQWERLGRAVPPVMMYYIAAALRDHVLHHVSSGLAS